MDGATPASILFATLRGHPRLGLAAAEVVKVKYLIEVDRAARDHFERVVKRAEELFKEAPVQRAFIGQRMLNQSRALVYRIYIFAFLFLIKHEQKWLLRAKEELLSAAAFTDWHPILFLDAAEMMHGVAIGYDWLYEHLSVDERKILRAALIEKGLTPALKAHDTQAAWTVPGPVGRSNWNIVCNASVITAALAVAEDAPDLAANLIHRAIRTLPLAFASYAPDGAWPEGPAYWHYATDYSVLAIQGLSSALGSDFNLANSPGFSVAGNYIMHAVGPSGSLFNHGDAVAKPLHMPHLFWLGKHSANAQLIAFARQALAKVENTEATVRDLLWYDPEVVGQGNKQTAPDAYFRGVNLAFFRSSWDDQSSVYVAVKGGDNKVTHTHLDLGTFVIDAQGVRWVLDLGPEQYDAPGYFGEQRWNFYRACTEGHNTVTLNGANQKLTAEAKVSSFVTSESFGYAIVDLSDAYAPNATTAFRGVILGANRSLVLVQDELTLRSPTDVSWAIHSMSEISVERNGKLARLQVGPLTMIVLLLSPADAVFSAAAIPLQAPNTPLHPRIRKLSIKVSQTVAVTISVVFIPVARGASWQDVVTRTNLPSVTKMHTWKSLDPLALKP